MICCWQCYRPCYARPAQAGSRITQKPGPWLRTSMQEALMNKGLLKPGGQLLALTMLWLQQDGQSWVSLSYPDSEGNHQAPCLDSGVQKGNRLPSTIWTGNVSRLIEPSTRQIQAESFKGTKKLMIPSEQTSRSEAKQGSESHSSKGRATAPFWEHSSQERAGLIRWAYRGAPWGCLACTARAKIISTSTASDSLTHPHGPSLKYQRTVLESWASVIEINKDLAFFF